MSTVKINNPADRLSKLIRMQKTLFHTNDLANIWQIQDKNTLHTTLKRYTKKSLLYRIFRGFYSILPISQINPYLLGVRAMQEFAYISCETVLFDNGIIFQIPSTINIISSISKRFVVGEHSYRVRQLDDQYLFNTVGISEVEGVSTASIERAVADILYFNPKYYFDADSLIDWKKVKEIRKQLHYIK